MQKDMVEQRNLDNQIRALVDISNSSTRNDEPELEYFQSIALLFRHE